MRDAANLVRLPPIANKRTDSRLVVLFVFMNERLLKVAGLAIRDAREAVHAAWELTHVGLTSSRGGDLDSGRETTGHVEERFVDASVRKKRAHCVAVGAIVAIYSAVMFTRVERLAAGRGRTSPPTRGRSALRPGVPGLTRYPLAHTNSALHTPEWAPPLWWHRPLVGAAAGTALLVLAVLLLAAILA